MSEKDFIAGYMAARKAKTARSYDLPDSIDDGVAKDGYDRSGRPCIVLLGHDDGMLAWLWCAFRSKDDLEYGEPFDCGDYYSSRAEAAAALNMAGYSFAEF